MDDGYSYLLLIVTLAAVAVAGYLLYRYRKSQAEHVTEEGIMTMVNEGHEQGVLESSEAEMITNIFELNDTEAGDIMTHRKNITALDGTMLLKDAARFILKEGNNSRYPVYGEDLDDIIGTLHMRDLLVRAEDENEAAMEIAKVPGLLREACFIPETRNINSLFKEMQSKKIHMEIVVDEYGQTAGLLTMEDILEEIVGNIMDEYDIDETFIVQKEDGTFLMQGMTPLDDVEDALSIEFDEEDMDNYGTLNGWLISKLDRIPEEEEQPEILYQDYRFAILTVANKIIEAVCVTRIPDENRYNPGAMEEAALSETP